MNKTSSVLLFMEAAKEPLIFYSFFPEIDKGHLHNHIIFCAVDMANQRALPYSTPRRYFLAFLLLQYTIRRNATAPATPTARSNRWKLGAALSKAREKPSARCNSFSDKSAQPPAGRSVPACRTGKQTADRAGWRLSAFSFPASS